MAITSETKFRSVIGTEEKILVAEQHAGWVYYAKDSGKIYLDDGIKRVCMGGAGVSVYYGNASSDDVIEQVDGSLRFPKSKLEDEQSQPKENDLIFNSNGIFYKILSSDTDYLYCKIIAVSGTGGGGSSQGGEGESSSSIGISTSGITSYSSWIYSQSKKISTTISSPKDTVVAITYTIKNTTNAGVTTTKTYGPYTVAPGVVHEFDVGKNLPEGTNSLTIYAVGDEGGNTSKSYYSLSTVIMKLDSSSNFTNLAVFTDEDIVFRCVPIGEGLTKTLKIKVDNILQSSLQKNNITTSGTEVQISIPKLSHGRHTIEAILYDATETMSCSLSYEIACAEAGYTDPIIWLSSDTPESIVNYTNLTINYMVYNPADSARAKVNYELNGENLPEQTVAYDAKTWLQWRVSNYIVGTNTLQISCGGAGYNFNVVVEEDTTRDLGIIKSGLKYNFDAAGRSNTENITSRQTWVSGDSSVVFKNFNWYNNGWISEGDDTFLRISNGASIEIPVSNLMKEVDLSNSSISYTLDFEFRIRNAQTYNLLVDTETTTTGDDDDSTTIVTKKLTNAAKNGEGIVVGYYSEGAGFGLGTQEAFLSTTQTTISGRYKEDEIVHLSFVFEAPTVNSTPLMYVYINGIASGIATYSSASDKLYTGTLDKIVINSNYCDIDLYKLRIYNTNLRAIDVIHNIIADYRDVDMYDANMNIVKYTNNVPTIDYDLMLAYNLAHPDNPLMPYMILESSDGILPYVKDEVGDGRAHFGVEFHNTYLDYAWEAGIVEGYFDKNSDYYKQSIAETYTDATEYYTQHCPSYTCTEAYLNVQGTSSQGYPRRNYKVKMKDSGKSGLWKYTGGPKDGKTFKKWFMDSTVGETSFCLKADYMESSRTHNTGLCSFLNTLYSKHPLEDYGISSTATSNYKTAIYGFPMMLFHKYNGKVEFIGLYNYNLDKSCKDSFGFTSEEKSKIYITCQATTDTSANATKTYYVLNDDKDRFSIESALSKFEDGVVYYEKTTNTGEGTFTFPLDLGSATECWQIEHNQGGKCSFKNSDFSMISTDPNKKGILAAAAEDFEIRYHPDKDNIEYAISGLGSFSTYTSTAGIAARNEYLRNKMSRLEKMVAWVCSTDPDQATNEPLEKAVTYSSVEYTIDSKEYRLAKFTNELEKHFDLEYTLIYFIITELLLCYDSRGKNCMLATWGPQEVGGEDIWYPIFYDIDTQLGINNSGVPYWDYYEEATKNNTFSTSNSVLWNNLWATRENQIKAKYQELRNTKLTYDDLNGYYSFNPSISNSLAMKGQRPMITVDVDEYYKYIDCAIGAGYVDTSGNSGNKTERFFYCLQGTRELQRELFLRNRFNYIDSEWYGGTYSTTGQKQAIQMRYDANNYKDTSDKYLNHEPTEEEKEKGFEYAEYPCELDTNLTLNITPYLKQYLHVSKDETHTTAVYANAGESVEVEGALDDTLKDGIKNSANMAQQLIYLGGPEYISSLGDLSTKYLDELIITRAKRLKDLIVGSDVPGYYNKMMNSSSFTIDDRSGDTNAKTLLEKIVLSNLGGLASTIDVSGSEKLKEFRALGTNIPSVTLADGVQIETLYLPKTITTLILKEPTSLTGVLSDASSYIDNVETYTVASTVTADNFANDTYYYYDEEEDKYIQGTEFNVQKLYYTKSVVPTTKYHKGLYIEGLTNNNTITAASATNINTINIIGGNMGYGSYDVVSKVVNIKLMMENNQNLDEGYSKLLSLNLENINWSPFRQVEYGESVNKDKKYKEKTEHCTFIDYTYTEDSWNKKTLNGYIFEYDDTVDISLLTDTSLFDNLINSYLSGNKHIYGISGADKIPYISGIAYINNTTDIKEIDLKNKYKEYWPELDIYVKNVEESFAAKFVTVADDVETEVDIQKFDKTEYMNQAPIVSKKIPSKANYDFKGWMDEDGNEVPCTLEEDGTLSFDFSSYVFDSEHLDYKFTAIFEYTYYTIHFVDGDGTIHNEKVQYPNKLSNPTSFIPYKEDDEDLADEEVYSFIGWSVDTNKENIVNLSDYIATKDYTFYSIFDSVSVYDNILDDSHLNFEEYTYNSDNINDYFDTYMISGYVMSTNSGILRGKITLPTEHNGKPIIAIDQSSSPQYEVTHVFWAKNAENSIVEFRANAFYQWSNLKKIEYPESLRVIRTAAFQNCPNLELPNFKSLTNLLFLGNQAYTSSCRIYDDTTRVLYIPGSVKRIGEECFYYLDYATNNSADYPSIQENINLQFGSLASPSNLSLNVISSYAFYIAGTNSANLYPFKNVYIYYTADDTGNYSTGLADLDNIDTIKGKIDYIGEYHTIEVLSSESGTHTDSIDNGTQEE